MAKSLKTMYSIKPIVKQCCKCRDQFFTYNRLVRICGKCRWIKKYNGSIEVET